VRAFSSKRRTSGTYESREVAEPRSGERGVQPQAAGEAVAEASEYEKEIHSYGMTNDAVVTNRRKAYAFTASTTEAESCITVSPCPAMLCLGLKSEDSDPCDSAGRTDRVSCAARIRECCWVEIYLSRRDERTHR